jgi:propionyl-CoA carboxylase alpha chain
MDNHTRVVENDWVVSLGGHDFDINLKADKSGSMIKFLDKSTIRVESNWVPGDSIAKIKIEDKILNMKVNKVTGGFRVRLRGSDLNVLIRNKRQFELSSHMLRKIEPDMTKFLVCPMPGMLIKVDVSEGEDVQEGQSLCVVEAMKMENVLRADKKGVIKKINVEAGQSLAVDEVIIEFE